LGYEQDLALYSAGAQAKHFARAPEPRTLPHSPKHQVR